MRPFPSADAGSVPSADAVRTEGVACGHDGSRRSAHDRRPAGPSCSDASDLLFYAALALLPVDGLVWGVQMPYWSPCSPVLFLAYALCNARLLPRLLAKRFPALAPMLALLAAVSAFGWLTVGVNATYALRTVLAMACAACTLLAFAVAWSVKRLPMRAAVNVLVCAYACAFLFGVFTWLIQPGRVNLPKVSGTLMGWFLRQYFTSRPQFLFAEPSYIGMHLFGVLLPMFWLTRDRRLPIVVVTFAAGALAMGSGVRIALDSVCALALCLMAVCPWRRVWRDRRLLGAVCAGVMAVCAAAAAAVWSQPRLRALFHEGLLAGDDSMSARIFRSVAPLTAGVHDWPHLLFGFGAGNLGEAMRRGYAATLSWYQDAGGRMSVEIAELRDPLGSTGNLAGNAFTMNAYVSFVTEFGLVAFAAASALIIRHVTRRHAWNARTVCWLLLLAYLHLQFEAYAFYALPLFLWATAEPRMMDMLNFSRHASVHSYDHSIADSAADIRKDM